MIFPDIVAALTNRAIDSAFLVQPFIGISAAQGTSQLVIPTGHVVPGMPSLLALMGAEFTRQQPEAARRYVTAQLRGTRDFWRAFMKNEGGQAEIIDILVKYLPIKDPAVVARTMNFSVDPNGELNESRLNEAQDYFVRIGNQQQRLDLSRVIDYSYRDYALQRLGRVQ